MSQHTDIPALLDRARAWAADDPDPTTRQEILALIDQATAGDHGAVDGLADRFSGLLEFGTAGLRGAIGGGPHRMNRAVVIRAAAGLTAHLCQETTAPTVVIGYDARHGSQVFAQDTAAVVTAAGGRALLLPRPLPTPVLAFAIRHLGADAGVMVTASHNPPQDNGYKVYLGDGMQIVPPADREIAAHIDAVTSVAAVPRADHGWQVLGEEVVDAYLEAVAAVVSADSPRQVSVVHTSMHGVGGQTLVAAFERAGYDRPYVVAAQADPDPDFPTVPFPNPEEPGAIDLALDLAGTLGPDVVIANDPDADRCAVAVDDHGTWRMLHGDELGALLGWHLLQRGLRAVEAADDLLDGPVFANSIVSSRLLAAMAGAAGVRHEETLTGFKWIARVPGIRYGYEEAIGYCVAPRIARDKDGISAALLVAETVATLRAQGRSVIDVLDELAIEHGLYHSGAYSVRVDDLGLIPPIMTALRQEPLRVLGDETVTRVEDLSLGGALPPTEGLRIFTDQDTRVIVRPSGTEPKLKVYLEIIEPVADDITTARARAAQRMAAIIADMRGHTEPR